MPSIPQMETAFGVHTRSTSLMNPGFLKPDFQRDYYKGQCMLCSSSEAVITLLLRMPPERFTTANFPTPGSSSPLLFPLTMGNYPETDVISSFLACDPCSFKLTRKDRKSTGDKFIAALPLVSFTKNRAAWLETINVATQKRFSLKDLPLVFLAILYTKLERLLEDGDSKAAVALRPALTWECSTLLQEVQLDQSFDNRTILSTALHAELLRAFRGTIDDAHSVGLLVYPVDGFIVANVALSNSYHKTQISGAKRERVVFFRFLYYLTEQYYKLASESGPMVLEATKMLILVFDEPAGPRSLLTLENLRQFSVHFKNLEELTQALEKRLSRRPQKFQPRKLSVSVKDLLGTPFLDVQALRNFRRLGVLFSWIENKAGHAISAFLHHLFNSDISKASPSACFIQIRSLAEMGEAMANAEDMSAKKVEDLIKKFPPILKAP